MGRARTRWKMATLVVAALLAALTAAIVIDRYSEEVGASTTQQFQFPDSYEGPVWVQVEEANESVDLHLEWGSWAADWPIAPDDARSYWFAKRAIEDGEVNPPLVVTVTPGVDVRIGYGQMPAGTRAAPTGAWYPIGDSAD